MYGCDGPISLCHRCCSPLSTRVVKGLLWPLPPGSSLHVGYLLAAEDRIVMVVLELNPEGRFAPSVSSGFILLGYSLGTYLAILVHLSVAHETRRTMLLHLHSHLVYQTCWNAHASQRHLA